MSHYRSCLLLILCLGGTNIQVAWGTLECGKGSRGKAETDVGWVGKERCGLGLESGKEVTPERLCCRLRCGLAESAADFTVGTGVRASLGENL